MITITGRIPSKKNSRLVVCRGKFPISLPSEAYTKWHKDASKQLQVFSEQRLKFGNSLVILMFAPDKRATDLTNKAESIMDLLTDNGFITDDNWFIISELRLKFGGVEKDNPRAEVYTEAEFETMMRAGIGGLFAKQ